MNNAYLDLIKQRPELFAGNEEGTPLRILTDERGLRELEQELGQELGVLYEDDYIILLRDGVVKPDGSAGTYIRIAPRVKESPVVILTMQGDKILLLSHYRHSARDNFWEFPRGFGTAGLTAEKNADKELREETSVMPDTLDFLGQFYPDTGMQSTCVTAYLAKLPEDADLQNADRSEAITGYRLVTLQELNDLIRAGQITDGFTLSTYTLALLKGKLSM